jgi:hypothetical protein
MNFKDFFEEYAQQLMNEKLALKGSYKGTIYQRLVAAQYTLAPSLEQRALPAFKDLIKKFSRQYEFLQSKFEYSPTTDDPYTSMKHLSSDIETQKKKGIRKPSVRVLSAEPGPEDDQSQQGHPLFDNDFNTKLRWVHDVIAHYYGKHPFSARGEYAAYNRHLKTLGPNTPAATALFTEVVGQTSCYYVYGSYVEQKVAILDDFDVVNVGLLASDSPLNEYFEVIGKTMVPKNSFNKQKFQDNFPELFEELQRQEDMSGSISPLTQIF